MTAPPAPEDIILGTTEKPYPHPQFRLSPTQQAYHGLIWGSTGTGKSKFIQSQVIQHISKGHAICLLDPHQDLSLDCLSYLAGKGYFRRPDAYEKLVYLDFGSDYSVPFNVLNSPFPPHSCALNILEALTRTWPDLKNAPLFRTLFLSSAIVLIANGLPLTAINHLLLDEELRASCMKKVEDPLVRRVFELYEKQGTSQAGSTLRRSFLLSFSPLTRACLGHSDNVLNIRALMDQGKSLIVNLGSIPDVATKRLIGSLIMVQIEQAALSRADIPEGKRIPWTCYVDEWPAIAATQGEALENLLTQARKYNLRLNLAAQALDQIDSKRLAGAFEQCRMSVAFSVGYDSARIQAKHIAPVITRSWTAGESNEPHVSRSEQMEAWIQAIVNLPPREAFVKIRGEGFPARIKTLTVNEPRLEPGALDQIIQEYRRRYQVRGDAGTAPGGASGYPAPASSGAGGFEGDGLDLSVLMDTTSPLAEFGRFFGEPGSGQEDA